jgi:predicted thioesterase
MDDMKVGETYSGVTVLDDDHSAVRYGNVGVNVAATPALIGLLETACHMILRRHIGAHEGSVGINVSVDHLAAAPIGVEVEATAEVKSLEGKRATFAVQAKWNGTVLMAGTHERAVVDLERFLASLPQRPK